MIRILKLVLLLVVSQVAFAQAPSNYTNINGRYRWIAGMFDSTFHIPKGSTPSLRTGGSTNAGGLFYNTADSSVYTCLRSTKYFAYNAFKPLLPKK